MVEKEIKQINKEEKPVEKIDKEIVGEISVKGDEDKIKLENEQEKKEKRKKKNETEIPKKDETIARGVNLKVSKKHCMYICSFIKGRKIDDAIEKLKEVIQMKRAIPFKGEIPHRKGMMSGRYPVKASAEFINLLKSLKGNVSVNGMDLDKTRIFIASSSWANRPLRKGNRKAKRSNVLLIAREIKNEVKK